MRSRRQQLIQLELVIDTLALDSNWKAHTTQHDILSLTIVKFDGAHRLLTRKKLTREKKFHLGNFPFSRYRCAGVKLLTCYTTRERKDIKESAVRMNSYEWSC